MRGQLGERAAADPTAPADRLRAGASAKAPRASSLRGATARRPRRRACAGNRCGRWCGRRTASAARPPPARAAARRRRRSAFLAASALAVLGDGVQRQARLVADGGDLVRRGAHQEHVPGLQRRGRAGGRGWRMPPRSQSTMRSRPWKCAWNSLERLADPRRFGLDDQLGVVAVELQVVRSSVSRSAARQQPARRATCRRSPSTTSATPIGVMENTPSPGVAAASQQVVGEQEGGRAEQRERRAERSGQRHRHEQARRRQLLLARQPHQDGQHHRRDHQVMRERGERGHRRHDDGDGAPLAARPRRAR